MNKGDIIRVEFSLWVADTNTLYNTNIESLAKEHKIYSEEHRYTPMPYIVGKGDFYSPIEDSFLTANVGEDVEVTIPPEKGEGERKADLVQIFPVRRIASLPQYKQKDAFPAVGDYVEIDGRKGKIVSLVAGRVRIDFNHELAGKTLRFRYKVTEVATDLESKIKAMIDMAYRYSNDFKISEKDGVVDIITPEVCKYDPAWTICKMKLIGLLREQIEFKTVRIIEEWSKGSEKKETPPSQPATEKKETTPTATSSTETVPSGSESEKKEDQ
jgi:FKBP-type peptidyl-prolyl cis-trans isomerase 2